MKARNFLRKGLPHWSRNSKVVELDETAIICDVAWALERRISNKDRKSLLLAIGNAKCEESRYINALQASKAPSPSRKMTLALLRAMASIKDDTEFLNALQVVDNRTFRAVINAQCDTQNDLIVWHKKLINGIDISSSQKEMIEEVRKHPISAYSTDQKERAAQLRMAVDRAIQTTETLKDPAGARTKTHQRELAEFCWWLWLQYRPNDIRTVSWASKVTIFASEIFKAAGLGIESSRVTDLMNEARKCLNSR